MFYLQEQILMREILFGFRLEISHNVLYGTSTVFYS